jgi:hypothetical protein
MPSQIILEAFAGYANTKFSGGSWYGVVREAHKLQKYSTPMIYPTGQDKPSRRLSEMPACPYLFFRLIFRWYFTPFRFKVKGSAGENPIPGFGLQTLNGTNFEVSLRYR